MIANSTPKIRTARASPLEFRVTVAGDHMKAIILGKPIVRIFFRILTVELDRVSHKVTILPPAKADCSFESFSTEFTALIVHRQQVRPTHNDSTPDIRDG